MRCYFFSLLLPSVIGFTPNLSLSPTHHRQTTISQLSLLASEKFVDGDQANAELPVITGRRSFLTNAPPAFVAAGMVLLPKEQANAAPDKPKKKVGQKKPTKARKKSPAKKPAPKKTTTKKPAAKKTSSNKTKPAVKKTAAKKPAAKKPVAKKPAAKKPAAKEPAAKQTVSKKPASKKATAAAKKSATGKADAEKPAGAK